MNKRTPSWNALARSEEFQRLDAGARQDVRDQFFVEVIAPNVPEDQAAPVKMQWDQATAPDITGAPVSDRPVHERTAQPEPEPAPEQPGMAGRAGRTASDLSSAALQGGLDTAGMFLGGVEEGGRRLGLLSEDAPSGARAVRGVAERVGENISPEGQARRDEFALFGPDRTMRGLDMHVAQGVGSMASSLGIGGPLTGMASRGLRAAGAGEQAARTGGAVVGFGAFGAGTGGEMSREVVTAELEQMDIETLSQAPVFREEFQRIREEVQPQTDEQMESALEMTREAVMQRLGSEAFDRGAVRGATLYGLLGPAYQRIASGYGGPAQNMVRGAITETTQEGMDSGIGRFQANQILTDVDGRPVTQDVLEEGVTGAFIGGLSGGITGAGTGGGRRALNREPADPDIQRQIDEAMARAEQGQATPQDEQLLLEWDGTIYGEDGNTEARAEARRRTERAFTEQHGQTQTSNMEGEVIPAEPADQPVPAQPPPAAIEGQAQPVEPVARPPQSEQALPVIEAPDAAPVPAQRERAETPDTLVRTNGQPFATERSARASQQFRNNRDAGAEIVPVEGGFGVRVFPDIRPNEPMAQPDPQPAALDPGIPQPAQSPELTEGPAEAGLSRSGPPESIDLQGQTEQQLTDQEAAQRESELQQAQEQRDGELKAETDLEAEDIVQARPEQQADQLEARDQANLHDQPESKPDQEIDGPPAQSRMESAPAQGSEESAVANIEQAAAQTDTDPSPAQIAADNYKKGRVRIQGLEITIENPKGSTRRGTDAQGNQWESTMAHHYGDIKRTEAADGDNVDVFIGDNPESDRVFVVDQVKANGHFDEVKALVGFDSPDQARQGYLANYEQGWQGLGEITEVSMAEFKQWLEEGDTTQRFASKANPGDTLEYESGGQFNERETGQVQGPRKGKRDSAATQGQLDLLAPSAVPSAVARRQQADNFRVRYEQVESGQLRVGYTQITSPAVAAHVFAPIRKHAQENMMAAVVDEDGNILNLIRHTKGLKDQSSVGISELVGSIAATEGGTGVWLSHNHPSGKSDPSESDFRVTDRINSALDGSGISLHGHVVITADGNAHSFNAESRTARAIKAEAAPRRRTIPMTERMLRRRRMTDSQTITHPDHAQAAVDRIRADNALLLLDNQHHVLGSLAISRQEMAQLRGTGQPRRILSALHTTNAAAAIVKTDSGPAGKNLIWYLNSLDVRALDVITPLQGSTASRGDVPTDTQWYSAAGQNTRQGMQRDAVQRIIDRLDRHWPGGIHVVQSISDLPQRSQQQIASDRASGVRGLFRNEDFSIWLVADNIRSQREAEQVLAHELVGHGGLRALFGADMIDILDQLYERELTPDMLRPITDNYQLDLNRLQDRRLAVEEYIAHVAQYGNRKPGWFKRLIAQFRRLLRRMGFVQGWSDADIQSVLATHRTRNVDAIVEAAAETIDVMAEGNRIRQEDMAIGDTQDLASRAGRSGSERTSWPNGFPDVEYAAALGAASNHPQYQAAKSGDTRAAIELVNDLLTDEYVDRIRAMIGDRQPTIVPVAAEEAAGNNRIPRALAGELAHRLNLAVDDSIVQAVRAHRTGTGIDHRLAHQPVFEGPVTSGQDYLIVDDTMTVGGTLANLRGHIEANGGSVVGATALTGYGQQGQLAISDKLREAIRQKHGSELEQYLQEEFGYGIDQLTQGEAGHIRKAVSLDALRDRIAEARRAAGREGDRSSDQGTRGQTDGLNEADDRFSINPFANRRATVFSDMAAIDSHVWEFLKLRGFWDSASDVLRRKPKLRHVADAVDQFYDRTRERMGRVNAIIDEAHRPVKRLSRKEQRAIWNEFESYMQARENGRRREAREILEEARQHTRNLVEAWNKVADITGRENQRVGVQVFDPKLGQWRDIGKLKTFWPRSMRMEVQEALLNPTRHPDVWERMAQELYDAGRIQENSIEAANQYLSKELKDFDEKARNDYFAGIEKARTEPLPEYFYDYSWDAAMHYKDQWAENVSRIEAFGQYAVTQTDLFTETAKSTMDKRTENYLMRVRDRVYNTRVNSPYVRIMGNLNMVATGIMLGNPATALLNLIGGTAINFQVGGTMHGMKALVHTMRNLSREMTDARAKGILVDDYLTLLHDAEQQGASQLLQKGVTGALKWGGYTPMELFIRTHGMVVGRTMLRDAMKHWNQNIRSRKSQRYIAWYQRNGFDYRQLMAENGQGAETDRLLRYTVNIGQGSYKVNQTPVFVDEPIGRFLFKYQKFGTQYSRLFWKNMLEPFIKSVRDGGETIQFEEGGREYSARVRTFLPLLQFFGVSMLAGTALAFLREALFGYTDPGPDLDELEKALENDDTALAMALAAQRAWSSVMAVGGFGFFGNYWQMLRDVSDRQRVKSPFDPPALSPLKGMGELSLRFFEQGGRLTTRDLDQVGQQTLSQYRTGKRLAETALSPLGFDFAELGMAYRTRGYTRKMGRRYADEIGLENKRRAPDRFGVTEMSAVNNRIIDALMLGQTERAQALMLNHLSSLDTQGEVDSALTSMRAAVRSARPTRISISPSERERLDFLGWVRDRVGEDQYRRILDLDERYAEAAQQAGLLRPTDPRDVMRQRRDQAQADREFTSERQLQAYLTQQRVRVLPMPTR